MIDTGNPLSRNPNVCASCSSMADGMEESNVPECNQVALTEDRTGQRPAVVLERGASESLQESIVHQS